MSRDFRPRKGDRLLGTWPIVEEPPPGWRRSVVFSAAIWRVATGEPADGAVEVIAYTETADCGVTHFRVAPVRGKPHV